MPVGLNAFKRRSRGGLILPGVGVGGAGLKPSAASALQNVIAWWDASQPDTTSLFVNDLVGSADLTGADVVGGTQNGRVTLVANNSGSSRLYCTSPINNRNHGTDPWGVTTVYKSATNSVMWDSKVTGTARPHVSCHSTANWNLNDSAAGASVTKDTNWHVHYCEFNGATTKHYIDGVLVATVNPSTPTAAGATFTFLNTGQVNVGPTSGTTWAEAKISTGVQTVAAILAEANALRAKWGF